MANELTENAVGLVPMILLTTRNISVAVSQQATTQGVYYYIIALIPLHWYQMSTVASKITHHSSVCLTVCSG